jgi:uncharacterized protein YdbL (DUF1318 family)
MYRQLRILAAALAAAGLAAVPALAGPALDAAKAACEVGETIDGYLAVVPGRSPSATAQAEMNEINNGRRAVYQQVARDNSQPLDIVARLTGERQVATAASNGQCFRDDGGWKMRQ